MTAVVCPAAQKSVLPSYIEMSEFGPHLDTTVTKTYLFYVCIGIPDDLFL
jgi:hypothetical protein